MVVQPIAEERGVDHPVLVERAGSGEEPLPDVLNHAAAVEVVPELGVLHRLREFEADVPLRGCIRDVELLLRLDGLGEVDT